VNRFFFAVVPAGSNQSIERTAFGVLRTRPASAHVER
jgi:hypothetical protein